MRGALEALGRLLSRTPIQPKAGSLVALTAATVRLMSAISASTVAPPASGSLRVTRSMRLDAVGALVDRGDPGVAIVLRGAGLLDVAHTAMHLDAERGDLVGDVGRERPWRSA